MILVLFLFSSDTISFCFSFNYKFCYFCICSSNVIAHNLQTTAQPNKLKIFTLQSLLTTLGTKITESQFSRSTWSGIHFHPCARLKRLVHTIHVATWFFFGHYFCGRSEHISDDQRLGSSDDSPSFVKSPPYILRSQPGWGSDYSVDSFPDRQTPIRVWCERCVVSNYINLTSLLQFNQWATSKCKLFSYLHSFCVKCYNLIDGTLLYIIYNCSYLQSKQSVMDHPVCMWNDVSAKFDIG